MNVAQYWDKWRADVDKATNTKRGRNSPIAKDVYVAEERL